jgi:alpha-tubulin suppressor-like RCC1 family protein
MTQHSTQLEMDRYVFLLSFNSQYSKLGDGTTSNSFTLKPSSLFSSTNKFIQFTAGQDYSLALTKDGRVFSVGRNNVESFN